MTNRVVVLASVLLMVCNSARAKTIDAVAVGAIGDGATLNTASIQKAIDDLSAAGGGTLEFPAGRYLTGTIEIKSNVSLYLDDNAFLLGSTNPADYRNPDPFKAGDGIPLGHALIYAADASHVGLEGPGTIDGQGKAVKAAQKQFTVRPFLVRWLHCDGVSVKDVHLTSPGAWTLNFFQSHDLTVDHVTIHSRGLVNNDGIDMDSCHDVNIHDCDIDSGDDAICFKATSTQPCRDINVADCKLSTRTNGIKLGTESLGDFQNIQAVRCDMHNIGMAGIALYCVDGAHMTGVKISDITMDGVVVPISMRLGARLKTFREGDKAKGVGTIQDIAVANVKATGAHQIGILINGVPNHPLENITLSNIQISLAGGGTAANALVHLAEKEATYPEMNMFGKVMPVSGLYVRHVHGITFENVRTATTQPDARPEAVLIDVDGMTPANFGATTKPAQ